jgi:aerobic-type carbon monoxide dehydrogenase small subunit (CoxS/CutS family)
MIEPRVNGSTRQVEAEPGRTLLSVLRGEPDLIGTKCGCGEGQCGVCAVLPDGKPTLSCQLSVERVVGKGLPCACGGQTPLAGIAPATGNAIHRATGVPA